jgi:molybdopterin-containing oxidoreductase family membrane subunit
MSAQEIEADVSAKLEDPVDRRAPLILGEQGFHSVTEVVANVVERKRMPKAWYVVFGIASTLLALFIASTGYLVWEGTGIWGLNNPVSWGWAIVNFVFWIGIGHAGTLISAVLYLFRQRWRTSINRAAEAMTIFALVCAFSFPLMHVGRVWLIYYLAPIPNQMSLWPQFRSPLLWDAFAVGIYGVVSVIFWYMGLIPDLGTMRDRAKTRTRQIAYGLLALGWRGSARSWLHHERAYLLLAALATPLVFSVHSVVSFDFAVSQLPGWHTTIFPVYFVAGAIFSGFAMIVTLMVVCHRLFGLQHIITLRHFDNMAKIMLLTCMIVAYVYAMELFIAWYGGNPHEWFAVMNRALGDYAWAYWIMIGCNVLSPQLLWIKRWRTNMTVLFVVSVGVNIGMWLERLVIVVASLHRDFLPSSWGDYSPTLWDAAALLGSFGLFFFLFCLFVRYLPMVALAETKTVLPGADPNAGQEEG